MSASLKETLALLKGAKNKYSRGQGKTVKFKEGKTKVRLLKNEAKFWRDLGVHWIKPDEKAKPIAVIGCHDHTYDKPCPVCTAIEKAIKSAVDDDQIKLYKEWKARKEVLVNAIVLDGPDAGPDPQIVSMTPTTFGNFLSLIETYAEADVDALDPNTGIDFIVERRGKGFDTEYQVMAAPVSKKVDPSVLKKLVDIDAFIEKEFFRGDEPKGLNAISEIAGITLALPAPKRASAMLTAPKEVDEIEEIEAIEAEREDAKAVAAAKAAAAAEALEKRAAAEARAHAAAEKAAKPAKAAETPAADDKFNADLPVDELDDVLAGLDDL